MAHFSRKNRKKSFSLGVTKSLANLLWIAEQKGFLADHNVNIDIVLVPYSRKAVEMMADGELDSAMAVETNISYLAFTKTKVPVKCLCSVERRRGDSILTIKENATPEDLRGMTIGFMPRTTSHTFLMEFLKQNNIDRRDIKLKVLSPQAMGSALIRNEIQAASIWQVHTSHAITAMNELGIPHTLFENPGYFYSETILACSKTLIVKNKPMVLNFLNALKDAERFFEQNKEEGHKILGEKFKLTGTDRKNTLDTFEIKLNPIGEQCLKSIEFVGNWIRENDTEFINKNPSSYSDYIDNQLFLDAFTEKE